MYQKLYIDSNLKNQHSEKLEKILIKNEIPFEYLEDNTVIESNSLFLTNDKDRVSNTLVNVFILNKEYDFLDVKNAIFIKRFEDVIRVFKNDVWKKWAQELQFLAQCTLAYSKDKFDRERSKRIREISCEM